MVIQIIVLWWIYLLKKGYVPIANTGNLICIRKDLYDKYINLKFVDDSQELGPAKYLSLFRYDNPNMTTNYLKN